jgi:hypothetical protein
MKIIFLCAGLFLSLNVFSQTGFQQTFDINGDDEFMSVVQTSDGGYINGGYSTGTPYGGIVVKTTGAGTVQWSKTVGGTRITEIAEGVNGTYYAAGEINVSSNTNFYLVKLSSNGTIIWARNFGKTAEPDQLYSMAVTPDGGVILSGNADSTAGSGFLPVGYVVKVDSSGNHQWSRYVSGGNGEIFYVTKPVSGGGYLSCGYTGSFGSQVGTEAYAVRWDANGNIVWTSVFGHNNRFDRIYDFVEKPNGGFFVSGNGLYTSTNDNLWMASLDSGGDVVWHHFYNMYEGAQKLLLLNDGNLAMCGYNISLNLGIYNQSYLIKTDTTGAVMWARQYGTGGVVDDKIHSAFETSDNGFVFAGSTYGTGIMRTSWIVRADSNGISACRDSSLTVTITNLTIASTQGGTVSSVSYNGTSPTGQLNATMSMQFFCGGPTLLEENAIVSVRIYPQPANDILNVETESAVTRIEIMNSSGALVDAFPVNGNRNQVDVTGLSAGLYFIRISSADGQYIHRFIRN